MQRFSGSVKQTDPKHGDNTFHIIHYIIKSAQNFIYFLMSQPVLKQRDIYHIHYENMS